MQRLTRLLAVLVLLGSACLFGAGPASADPLAIGQCTTTANVILAVDFSHWGGPLLRSCGSTPTTGYTLLNQGGWTTAGTQHDGPAFICRIGYSGYAGGARYPTASTEACRNTPPASAYWSYWHANPGASTWSYSQLGAMSYKPVAGSVDLWIYGGTNIAGTQGTPTISPDSVRAHNTSPTGGVTTSKPAAPPPPPATKPAGGSGGSSSSGSGSSGSAGGSTGGSSTGGSSTGGGGSVGGGTTSTVGPLMANRPTTPAQSAVSSKAASRSAANSIAKSKATGQVTTGTSALSGPTASASTSGTPKIVDAEPAADIKHSSGSYVPELVAGVILVVLGGFTGVRHWRRKQVSQQS